MTDIVEQLRNHALPDAHDEREVMHAPLLKKAADEIERLRAEVKHWKANHDNRVEAARVLIERNDLPFDRVPAYKHYLHLQEDVAALRAENESLRKVFDAAENLVKVKGRFHSEQAYGRLVTAVAGMKVEE